MNMTMYKNTLSQKSVEELVDIILRKDDKEKEKNKLINSVVKARRKSGLTQTQLEEKSGIKQPVIARIEKGISCPNIDTLLLPDRDNRGVAEVLLPTNTTMYGIQFQVTGRGELYGISYDFEVRATS